MLMLRAVRTAIISELASMIDSDYEKVFPDIPNFFT